MNNADSLWETVLGLPLLIISHQLYSFTLLRLASLIMFEMHVHTAFNYLFIFVYIPNCQIAAISMESIFAKSEIIQRLAISVVAEQLVLWFKPWPEHTKLFKIGTPRVLGLRHQGLTWLTHLLHSSYSPSNVTVMWPAIPHSGVSAPQRLTF